MPSLLYRAARYGYFTAQERLRPLLGEGFELDGRHYRYFYSHRGMTWRTERIVEVPLALEFLARHRGKRVLEVGNVMRQYGETGHTVVDKYERAPGVINEDAATFTAARFDAILSISTLEHVGYSEAPSAPDKFRLAVETIVSWLAPEGRLVFTVPLGYNPAVGEYLASDPACVTSTRWMRRVTIDNLWRQTDREDALGARYDHPWPGGNAIAIVAARRA